LAKFFIVVSFLQVGQVVLRSSHFLQQLKQAEWPQSANAGCINQMRKGKKD
jgi:hypothetical protein